MPIQKESQAAGMPPMINLGLSAEDPPRRQKCETNPIPPRPRPKNAKRTQFHPGPRPKYAKRTQFTHTWCPAAPNYAKRTQFHVLPPPQQPKNAKRTQSQPHYSLFYETNPIRPHAAFSTFSSLAGNSPRRPISRSKEPAKGDKERLGMWTKMLFYRISRPTHFACGYFYMEARTRLSRPVRRTG